MLTNTEVLKAKPRDKEYRMADGRGLYLAVTPTGGKLWRYKYRFLGKEKLMSFGQYPDLPLVEAREKHAQARRVLASGVDPMAARKEEKIAAVLADELTFHSVALDWFSHWKVNKDPSYVDRLERRLVADVYPVIGSRHIGDIKAPAIVDLVKGVERRGAADVARRILITIGQIYRYAIAHNKAERNPAADIKPGDILKQRVTKNFARIESHELPSLLQKIELYTGKPVTRLAIKLMALVFIRTKELIGGRWEEVDFEQKRWTIPASRMKRVKGSVRTPHIVPLSTQAIGILRLLQTLTGKGELMFPADRGGKGSMSNNTILFALDTMGYGGAMTGHGFRGVASTILYEHEFHEDHIELQLAHMPRNKVRAAYDHARYLKQRAELMQWWGDYIEAAARPGGKVLTMRAG